MSKRMGQLWPAEPHTKAKIIILREYLNAWFPVFGRSRPNEPILYVDGFAGPGEYANDVDGSPLAALKSAANALSANTESWKAGDIHCVFAEQDPVRYEHLSRVVNSFATAPRLHAKVINGQFVDAIASLRRTMSFSFSARYPLFVFIDPFGAKGVPFNVVSDLLSSPSSEVLLNFDADGIMRVYGAGEHANHEEILNEVYGGDVWKHEFQVDEDFSRRCRRAVDLYIRRLRQLEDVRYTFRFEMRGATGRLNYYLVFASKHPLGLKKMKEAMRKVDQSGQYSFSDGAVDQGHLFRFDDSGEHAREMHQRLLGRSLDWSEIEDYVLNETPFIVPSPLLEVLEESNLLAITASQGRRRGQFTKSTIRKVEFLSKPTGFGSLFDAHEVAN